MNTEAVQAPAVKTLLQINASLFSAGGQSSQLADQFVAAWRANNADATVHVRDVASQPLPHLRSRAKIK